MSEEAPAAKEDQTWEVMDVTCLLTSKCVGNIRFSCSSVSSSSLSRPWAAKRDCRLPQSTLLVERSLLMGVIGWVFMDRVGNPWRSDWILV